MNPIISSEELYNNLSNKTFRIFDCRFSLNDVNKGRQDYLNDHIPGALYAHLDDDLSGIVEPGRSGRHPLPNRDKMIQLFSKWGLDNNSTIVAYDDSHGGIAARLWMLAKWLGHDKVAVLSGGYINWKRKNFPVESKIIQTSQTEYQGQESQIDLVSSQEVESAISNPDYLIVDARSAERYAGVNEPIDPIAGHIPTAINLPFIENLEDTHEFKSPAELRHRFQKKWDQSKSQIMYCGSGVTACHNMIAIKVADLSMPKLYVGSWSEWIVDEKRSISTSNSE